MWGSLIQVAEGPFQCTRVHVTKQSHLEDPVIPRRGMCPQYVSYVPQYLRHITQLAIFKAIYTVIVFKYVDR